MDIIGQSHDKGRSLEGSGVPRDVGAIRTSEKEQLHCTIPSTIPGGSYTKSQRSISSQSQGVHMHPGLEHAP